MAKGIPSGFHSVSPYLVVKDAAAAIEFYKKAFGAVEKSRLVMPGTNLLLNAKLLIGDSIIMLMDEMDGACGDAKFRSPLAMGGTTVALSLYVEDADAVFDKAVAAGAEGLMPVSEMFWGDRYGKVKDPFGHEWGIATQVRELDPKAIQEGMEACFREMQTAG